MNILIYLIKTVLVSGLLFGYYWLFLRNRFFHGFNRFFLLVIPALSLLLPALHFNLPAFWNQSSPGSPIRLLGVGRGTLEEAVTIYANQHTRTGLSWGFILVTLSLLMSTFLFIRLYKSIRFLYLLRKENPLLVLPEATVYFVSEKGTPFSFFKSIFWGKELELNSEAGKQILEHEIFHVKNNHSLDILLLEILTIGIWFNPFLYLIHQELKAIHEYEADAWVAAKTDGYAYASLLLLKVSGSALPLTHPFFKNQIKRRIAMMTKTKKQRNSLLGRFLILPLIVFLSCLFSFKIHNPLQLFSPKAIRVVIDAGHGGIDPGLTTKGIPEKNTNLSIAKKIQELAKEYNVEVIMTREKDELPGSGNDINWSLKYRTALPRQEDADLFISIHTGSGTQGDASSGFEIYIPGNESKIYKGSVKLATCITGFIKPDYTIAPELKQRSQGIMVLTYASVPAILIECGNQNNKSDFDFIQNDKNQEKIARDILEGIRKYSMETTRYAPPVVISADSIPSDTLTLESLKNFDVSKIKSMNVDKNAKLITITLKDGRRIFEVITPEMIHSWDSAKAANLNSAGATNANQAVFTKVEVEAEYPGGQQAWFDYLQKNLKYPEAAVMKEIQGQ
ncbi:MAG TPA: M56/M15 family metallopeptidase, partial [Puia sp.]